MGIAGGVSLAVELESLTFLGVSTVILSLIWHGAADLRRWR